MTLALTLLLCLGCLAPAAAKLSGQPMMRASARRFGIPWKAYRLIGLLEVTAAAGLLAGLHWHPVGDAAAIGTAILLAGALAAHLRAADRAREMAPAVVVLALALAYLSFG